MPQVRAQPGNEARAERVHTLVCAIYTDYQPSEREREWVETALPAVR
jgi:hypothetical protein